MALAIVSCDTERDDIDAFGVGYDATLGPVLVTISHGLDGTQVAALLDILSPITLIDTFEPGQPAPTQTRRTGELILHGLTSSGTTVPRHRFPDTDIFDLHPCGDDPGFCQVGQDANTRAIQAVVGTDVLADNAIRFDFSAATVYLFPDIAGESAVRGEVCDVVFPSPFSGGGTLIIGGAEVGYTGGRVALGACAAYDITVGTGDERPSYAGVDLLFVLSTGIAPSILGQAAYERYARAVPGTPSLSSLADTTLYLPSGAITGKAGTIQRLALTGEASELRGPCKELYANYLMSTDECTKRPTISNDDCPCNEGRFCRTAGAVELDTTLDVVVVSDVNPLLQALRNELRPDLPEVDGILGVHALSALSVDFDYPNNRVLARCAGATGCVERPEVRNRDSLEPIAECMSR